MKKLTFILCAFIICFGCTKEKSIDKTKIGMFTPYNYFPEVLHGKVKMVKETNFLPVESDGKIEAGAALTVAARDTINWTNDFLTQFNTLGFTEKTEVLGDDGKIIATWEITSDDNFYTSAKRMINDTIDLRQKITQIESGLYQIELFDPVADTLFNSVHIEMNNNKDYNTIQWYNFKGEPTSLYQYTYNPPDQLVEYTVSRADTVRGGMKFTRDENGFMKTQEVFNLINAMSESTIYEYENDEFNNWVKCIAYQDQKPIMVVLREYEYY